MASGGICALGGVPRRIRDALMIGEGGGDRNAPMNVLLQEQVMDRLAPRVLEIAPDCILVPVANNGQALGEMGDGDAILLRWWGLDGEGFQKLVRETPGLRWIHTISTGVNHVLFPFLVESDIVLTNARGVYDGSVAEMVLAYMLAVVKELATFHELKAEHRWKKAFLQEMNGLTVGIVGFGGIGRRVSQMVSPFGVRLLATRRRMGSAPEPGVRILPSDQLCDLMAESDFVVVTVPLTGQTRHLIDARSLAHAKPGAWLINVSRGGVVDETALVHALREGPLGGACLDVFEEEPLPTDSALWDLPNVIITPHTSGLSPRLYERSADLFVENLRRYVTGEPLLNVVDKAAGY